VGVAVGLEVGVAVGLEVAVAVGLEVGVAVGIPVGVFVGLEGGGSLGVAVGVSLEAGVFVGLEGGDSLGVVAVGLGVGVSLGVAVGVFVGLEGGDSLGVVAVGLEGGDSLGVVAVGLEGGDSPGVVGVGVAVGMPVAVTVGLGVGVQEGTSCVQLTEPEPKAPSDHWAATPISAYGPSTAKVYCSASNCVSAPPARRRRVIWAATVAPGRCSRDMVKAMRVGLKRVQVTVTAPNMGVGVAITVCAMLGATPMVVRHSKPSTMLATAARNCIMVGPSASCGGGRIGGRRRGRMAAPPL
jgi:hypothetical protein